MADPFINVYTGNPTEGATDGTAVSTDGAQTAPISFTLDATINESKKAKLAIRTESGYRALANTVIQDVNDTNDRWKLSLTENGTFSDTLTFPAAIDSDNTVFWAQASASSLETPTRDISVFLAVSATIEAV